MNKHEKFMHFALQLAEKGRATVSPNPLVGCVIVKKGRIIGKGYHKKAGEPHAEIHALKQAGFRARGATLYTTLEPCSHWGRTPPCTQAIIKAGIREVVIALEDPNWRIHGIEELRKHGIRVVKGILEQEAKKQNEVFVKYISKHMPFVILKMAVTADGKIAIPGSRHVTSKASRAIVHQLRTQVDAVMVGKNTVVADNPRLTPRLVKGKNPLKIVVDSSLSIPNDALLLHRPKKLIIATTNKAPLSKIRHLEKEGVMVIVCAAKNGKVSINDMMKKLAQLKVTSILLESGGSLALAAFRAKVVDRVVLFISPKVVGKGTPLLNGSTRAGKPIRLKHPYVRHVGQDVMIEGYV
jgi:diaminohydroxyphosphoribosylaminopyrimidine deaminase/5-amino-6-(5-phosphoribosylamino)uracil reductase